MKKIIISILMLFLAGCGCNKEALKGYITVECIKTNDYKEVIDISKVIIKHKDNNITNIIYSYKYETQNRVILDSYKQSLISQSNQYKNDGILISNNDLSNSFEMIYDIDVTKVNDNIKEDFDVEDIASTKINKLEREGYSCS
ncbi:MAG: hypothetical protein NC181_04310 [Clostridium sp.]|nr:hypothetical protein [Clostridium sp.]MCM1444431.1 hypothetical protein [Candidatus Amulumruptor caecigallinarius]